MKTYGSKNTIGIIQGVPVTGLAPGDDVWTFKLAEDRVKKSVGIDGAVALAVTNDETGEVTLKLMQTSPTNLALLALSALQKQTTALIPIALLFQDTFRQDRIIGINGWIETTPEVNRGAGINIHEWKFGFETLTLAFSAL